MRTHSARRAPAVAYHEAGHAVMAVLQGVPTIEASIIPGEGYAGYVAPAKEWLRRLRESEYDDSPQTKAMVEAYARVALAGGLAKRRFRPRSNWNQGSGGDYQQVFTLLGHICGSQEECNAYAKLLTIQTRQLLNLNWPAVEAVAERLLEEQHLRAEEVEKIVQEAPVADVEVE